MSATLRNSPSWLRNAAEPPTTPTPDQRYKTYAAKESTPRARALVGPGLFEEKDRARKGSERESLEDGLGELEGIGVAAEGGWTIAITEVPKSKQQSRKYDLAVTVYVSTPTSSLTLTRKVLEIRELVNRLLGAFPGHRASQRTVTRAQLSPKKRGVLASLSRTLSPRRNGSLGSFARPGRDADPSTKTSLPELAEVLARFSRDVTVREHAAWQRFFSVRKDDLKSAHVERRIKRYRSDQTLEVSRSAAAEFAKGPLRQVRQEASGLTDTSAMTDFDSNPVDPHRIALMSDLGGSNSIEKLISSPGEQVDAVELPSVSQVQISSQPDKAVSTDPPDVTLSTRPPSDASMADEAQAALALSPVDRPSLAIHPSADEVASTERDATVSRPAVIAEGEVALSESPQQSAMPTPERLLPPGTALATGMTRSASDFSVASNNTIERRSKTVSIDSFEIMRVLGKGCAGKVLLVREKATDRLMALKAITKRHVLAHRELVHTRTEQSVLKACARDDLNPFVVKLHYSFHDEDTLYLALDFHPGGDLATQMARWGCLGYHRARFYICEILAGVESLHRAGIIYRDLKPENVLISAQGHIVLTDFGLSKDFQHDLRPKAVKGLPRPHWLQHAGRSASTPPSQAWLFGNRETTKSFCGTAEYLAPEVLLGEPYSYEVDIWSAGTMLYEMLAGVAPFWASDHAKMYQRILHDPLLFDVEPEQFSDDVRLALRGMLQRDPLFRITIARLKRSPYLANVSWSLLENKCYDPPFVPELNPLDPTDLSQFDNTFLSMPAQVKGDPEHEPGAGREPPQGEAQPRFDDTGRDVFDGYSYYGGRDSASIHDSDPNDEADDYGASTPPLPVGNLVEPTYNNALLIDHVVDTRAECGLANDLPVGELRDEDSPTETGESGNRSSPVAPGEQGGDGVALHVVAANGPGPAGERDTPLSSAPDAGAPQEAHSNRSELPSVPEAASPRGHSHDAIIEDSDEDWVALEAEHAPNSVRNGGREATLWQRGFRDKYRMALGPLTSPARTPRQGQSRQASRAASSSSVISSVNHSPTTTPEPSSSPRPGGVIRRFTSPRPSLGSLALKSKESQRSLDPGTYGASHGLKPASPQLGGKVSKTSLAPSGSSTNDRSSSIGGQSRKTSPIQRLAQSASGFIDKL